jgi:hypothetical protein
MDFMTYTPTLPLICYSPGAARYGAALTTTLKFPAQEVFRSYANVPSQYDSYQVLVTCYPPDQCPNPSLQISHSCCDYGSIMTSFDGQTASGTVHFVAGAGGAGSDGGSDAGLDAAEQ